MDRRFIIGMLKDWGLALLIVFGVLVVWSALTPHPPSSGIAPDFELSDLEGGKITLVDLPGEVVVLNFWATWCGPCRAEIPDIEAFHKAHPEIGIYGISVDEGMPEAKLKSFVRKMGMTYPVLHDSDGRAYAAYGLDGIPATFVLDRTRTIRKAFVGAISREQLEAAVDRINPPPS